ncbi:hypothetical protein PR048_016275 [Dryococelus australis]|uniref:Uncharacterized protein n=1 Tax=Dryococelus australis TaxID=614101 RepID=A0ABQ9HJA2_9NEOP|nr:hypothetical protein PR048_016275 [Dryococelus australis]
MFCKQPGWPTEVAPSWTLARRLPALANGDHTKTPCFHKIHASPHDKIGPSDDWKVLSEAGPGVGDEDNPGYRQEGSTDSNSEEMESSSSSSEEVENEQTLKKRSADSLTASSLPAHNGDALPQTQGWPTRAAARVPLVREDTLSNSPACQPRPSLLDTRSRRLPFRWSLVLLSLGTQPLIHSTPTPLPARRPAAIFIALALTIWKVRRTPSRADRMRSIVSNPEHSSDKRRKQYNQGPWRASVILNPPLTCLRRRYHITTLFTPLISLARDAKHILYQNYRRHRGPVARAIPSWAIVALWLEHSQVVPQWPSGWNEPKGPVAREIPSGAAVAHWIEQSQGNLAILYQLQIEKYEGAERCSLGIHLSSVGQFPRRRPRLNAPVSSSHSARSDLSSVAGSRDNKTLSRQTLASHYWGRGGAVVRLLASHQGETDSIPGGAVPRFLHVGIVPDDAADWRGFSGISRFIRPCLPALFHTHLTSPSSALKISLLRAAHLSSLTPSRLIYMFTYQSTFTVNHESPGLRTHESPGLRTGRRCGKLRSPTSFSRNLPCFMLQHATWPYFPRRIRKLMSHSPLYRCSHTTLAGRCDVARRSYPTVYLALMPVYDSKLYTEACRGLYSSVGLAQMVLVTSCLAEGRWGGYQKTLAATTQDIQSSKYGSDIAARAGVMRRTVSNSARASPATGVALAALRFARLRGGAAASSAHYTLRFPAGSLSDYRAWNRVGQSRWSASFLGDLPFSPSPPRFTALLHTHLTLPSLILKTPMLKSWLNLSTPMTNDDHVRWFLRIQRQQYRGRMPL